MKSEHKEPQQLTPEQKEFQECLTKAESNDATAQYKIGKWYVYGHNVEKDDQQAFYWFNLAAKNNVSGAQHNLGFMYFEGRGVRRDHKQAAHWIRLAANQGAAPAQQALGYFYWKGQAGFPKDDKLAAHWLNLAAGQGDALAEYQLAEMAWNEKKKPEAARRYHWAMKFGLKDNRNHIAILKRAQECIEGTDKEIFLYGAALIKQEFPPEFKNHEKIYNQLAKKYHQLVEKKPQLFVEFLCYESHSPYYRRRIIEDLPPHIAAPVLRLISPSSIASMIKQVNETLFKTSHIAELIGDYAADILSKTPKNHFITVFNTVEKLANAIQPNPQIPADEFYKFLLLENLKTIEEDVLGDTDKENNWLNTTKSFLVMLATYQSQVVEAQQFAKKPGDLHFPHFSSLEVVNKGRWMQALPDDARHFVENVLKQDIKEHEAVQREKHEAEQRGSLRAKIGN